MPGKASPLSVPQREKKKNPNQNSIQQGGKKELGMMTNLSCLCSSVSGAGTGGHQLPGHRSASPGGEPGRTAQTLPALRRTPPATPIIPPCLGQTVHTLRDGSRHFPVRLSDQPKTKITQPRKCCVETSRGDRLSLKASEPFAA